MSAHQDGRVTAVSRDEEHSFSKPEQGEIILVAGLGVEGDAHAGVTARHRGRVAADPTQPNLRQVHLIHDELFDELRAAGYEVRPGQLGENVTTRGIDLLGLPRGTILRFGSAAADAADRATASASASGPRTPGMGLADGSAADGPARPGAAGQAESFAAQGGLTGAFVAPAGEPVEAIAAVVAAAGRATLNEPTRNALAALVAAAERAGDKDGATVVVTGLRNPCGQINGFKPGLLKRVIGHDQDGNLIRKGGVMAVVLRGGPIRPGDPVVVELPPLPHLPLEPV